MQLGSQFQIILLVSGSQLPRLSVSFGFVLLSPSQSLFHYSQINMIIKCFVDISKIYFANPLTGVKSVCIYALPEQLNELVI